MKNYGIGLLVLGLLSFGLTGCSSGGGGGSAAVDCTQPANYNNQKCIYGGAGAGGAGGGGIGVAGAGGVIGAGTFIMGLPKDGRAVLNLNRANNAVARWAVQNNLCNASTVGTPQFAFDCLSIVSADFTFHIDMDDNSGYYGGYYGQQQSIGQARWRLVMTDQFGHRASSDIINGRALKIGNGFQIQSDSTVISALYSGGLGAMTVTLSYHANGAPVYNLGSGTMRGN